MHKMQRKKKIIAEYEGVVFLSFVLFCGIFFPVWKLLPGSISKELTI